MARAYSGDSNLDVAIEKLLSKVNQKRLLIPKKSLSELRAEMRRSGISAQAAKSISEKAKGIILNNTRLEIKRVKGKEVQKTVLAKGAREQSQRAYKSSRNAEAKEYRNDNYLVQSAKEHAAKIRANNPLFGSKNVTAELYVPPKFLEQVQNDIRNLKHLANPTKELNMIGGSNLVNQVKRVATQHRANYLSYLDSLNKILSTPITHPAVHYTKGERGKRYTFVNISAKVGQSTVRTNPSWEYLSLSTMNGGKDEDGNEYKGKFDLGGKSLNFWYHTGKLSRAFSRAVASQHKVPLTKNGKSAFYTDPVIKQGQTTRTPNQVDFTKLSDIHKYSVQFSLTLPGFRDSFSDKTSTSPVLQQMIIQPYLTGVAPKDAELKTLYSVKDSDTHQTLENEMYELYAKLAELGNKRRDLALKRESLKTSVDKSRNTRERNKIRQSEIEARTALKHVRFKMKQNMALQNRGNITRMVEPEMTRPFIRRLSVLAGKAARQQIKSL